MESYKREGEKSPLNVPDQVLGKKIKFKTLILTAGMNYAVNIIEGTLVAIV